MKFRIVSLFIALVLILSLFTGVVSAESYTGQQSQGSSQLRMLEHNCTNTGIMLPEKFDPNVTTYLLTVGYNVSRPYFIPTAVDPNSVITVNGSVVKSGEKSQVIPINDKPQTVKIVVTNGTSQTVYTIYIQRRPSTRRTKVSAGYLTSFYQKSDVWHLDADLVTLSWNNNDVSVGALAGYDNKDYDHYDYELDPHCLFYVGVDGGIRRVSGLTDFVRMADLGALYFVIYMEDKVVAIIPYGAAEYLVYSGEGQG